jgi:putative peptidoglycan lipid II flippase
MELPTALLGVALSVVLTPQLSAAQAQGDMAAYSAAARLGPAPGAAAGAALRRGAAGVRTSRWWRCCSTVARSTLQRGGHGVHAGGDGLRRRTDGVGRREGGRAGLLRPQDMATPMRVGHWRCWCSRSAQRRCSCPGWAWPALALSIGLAALVNAGWLLRGPAPAGLVAAGRRLAGAGLAGGAGQHGHGRTAGLRLRARVDWVALGAHEAQRAGLLRCRDRWRRCWSTSACCGCSGSICAACCGDRHRLQPP